MLNFAMCDDNIIILDRLKILLEKIFLKNDLDARITYSSTNPIDVLKFIENNHLDVLLLDIDLKDDFSGLDLANEIRKNDKNLYLIFLTAHLEYALMAYKLKTFDYLSKPITMERLEETVLRIFDDIKDDTNEKFIKLHNSKIILKENDILYIKKDGMKLIYKTLNSDYETYSSFSKVENTLPENFIRCHKSYIVNLNNVKNIESNNKIIFNENISCNIGPKYKQNLLEVFNNGNISEHLDSTNNKK